MAQQLAYDEDGKLLIDVRGPRFAATVTMVVLALAIVIQGDVGTVILGWQVLAFAVAAILGLRYSLYGNLFRLLKHRLDWGPPPDIEPEAPPRFSQLMGLIFSLAGLIAIALGAKAVGWFLAGIVLALSTLLSLTGFCVGCEMYLLGKRVLDRAKAS